MGKKSWKRPRKARPAVKILEHRFIRELLLFLLPMLIFYFGVLGFLILALRTDEPWAAVISNSMRHGDDYWREYFEDGAVRRQLLLKVDQNLADVVETFDTLKFPLQGGFERGDMLVIQGVGSPAQLRVGDVVVAEVGGELPLTHRVFHMWEEDGETLMTLKGDNNDSIQAREKSVRFEQIKGRVVFVIPELGWLSIWWRGS